MKNRFANTNRRVGICAGCVDRIKPGQASHDDIAASLADQPLFRVGNMERWRCRECYKRETGGYP